MRSKLGFALYVGTLLLAFSIIAFASDVDVRQSNDMNTATTGKVNTGSNRALGLAGGDVDIAQCYRSYSYLIVWTDTKPNPLCLAQQLMAEGNYEAAAVLRCKPRSVWKPFGSRQACIVALAKPPAAPVPIEAPAEVDDDEEDEFHEEQLQLYADLLTKIEMLEAEVDKPVPVQRTVVEQHGLTDEQRAALREVVK